MTLSETWVDFVAGWCSGATAVLLCQPVDTVLTRYQAGLTLIGTTTTTTTTTTATTSLSSSSSSSTAAIIQNTKGLVSNSGMTALWRGSTAMITAVPMQNALLMGGYGIGKKWSSINNNNNTNNNENNDNNSNNNISHLMSIFVGGCTGGILQSFLMSPVELIKVNQQVFVAPPPPTTTTTSKSNNTNNTNMKIKKHKKNISSSYFTKNILMQQQQPGGGGIAILWNPTFWKGLNATLLRDGIPHGVWFVSYEWCKNILHQQWLINPTMNDNNNSSSNNNNNKNKTTTEQITIPIVSGAFAATVAWAVGYPFDIIKTRIQASITNNPHSTTKGIYDTTRELIQESNGRIIVALYRGFGLKLIRAIPASMIGFTTYEFVSNQLQ